MVVQASNNGWDMPTVDTQQIFEYKTTFPSLMETRRFPFWAGLIKVKQDFLQFGTFKIKNDSQIRF
jgi:hypothetical protein